MSTRAGPAPLTVTELVNGGPLARARLVGSATLEAPVHGVRIVDDITQIAGCPPHTVLVLTTAAARGGWAVEAALRHGWERAAACVVAPATAVTSRSPALVSTRLGTPLVAVDGSPHDAALDIATAVAEPEAARARLTAHCALRLAEAGGTARAVLGVLNGELPGVQVAFASPFGELLAGRRAALEARSSPATRQEAGRTVTVEVGTEGGVRLGELVALLATGSRGWEGTVRDVLRIATGPLAAWAATRRLSAERDPRIASSLLPRLLASPDAVGSDTAEAAAAEAAGLGWALRGRLLAVALLPVTEVTGAAAEHATPSLSAIWARMGAGGSLVRDTEAGGWLAWHTLPEDADGDAAVTDAGARCQQGLRHLSGMVELAAGVGEPGRDLDGLRLSAHTARAAAAVARRQGQGVVEQADALGPRRLLAAIPVTQLAEPARQALARLLASGAPETLLDTLAALLDAGGATRTAAQRLGVHRNTVTARLERLRELGLDPADAHQRLALHLACHVLLAEREQR